jgi:hypothetical protein
MGFCAEIMQTWEAVLISQLPIILAGFLVYWEFRKIRALLERIEKRL